MKTIAEHLQSVEIDLAPGKLGLVKRGLSGIIRSPNLVPQPGRRNESVWQHTGSMLDTNYLLFIHYPSIVREIDYPPTVGGIFSHDISEQFTPLGDLSYSNDSHKGDDLRRQKELDENEATHHFVEKNIRGKDQRLMLHRFSDDWAIMKSPLALHVRLGDIGDGNLKVICKAMDLGNGVIQKIDSNGVVRIWPVAEAGEHISNMAASKTFPIVEKLISSLKRKEASLSILDWFNNGMMKTYADAGWGSLPVIQEMQWFLDKELKGFEI